MMTIAEDGDGIERLYWRTYMECHFPSYEKFWQKEVVPITYRDMVPALFRPESELKALGKSEINCYLAQLHYSIMFQLGLAHSFTQIPNQETEYTKLLYAFTALLGATDKAFQLLSWWAQKDKWQSILSDCTKSPAANVHMFVCFEEKARPWDKQWRDKGNNDTAPLQKIRDYRDKLIHRGLRYTHVINGIACLPGLNAQDKYGKWGEFIDEKDFVPAAQILWESWKKTVDYIELKWKDVLLK